MPLSRPSSPSVLSDSARNRVGRRRDASRDATLRRAALDLIAEVGYEQMTMESVALRAGAGKATVYRRWSSKAELVADALAQGSVSAEVADTGSLRGDLAALGARMFGGTDAQALYQVRLVRGMVSAMLTNPELRRASEGVITPPERAMEAIIARAVARGEINAPNDPHLVAAVLPAMGLYRLIFRETIPDPGFAAAMLDRIVLPTLTAGLTREPVAEADPRRT